MTINDLIRQITHAREQVARNAPTPAHEPNVIKATRYGLDLITSLADTGELVLDYTEDDEALPVFAGLPVVVTSVLDPADIYVAPGFSLGYARRQRAQA